jgi:NAD(P)-dependent dehydrogenase (short-subunit alcohol dehydrogenase family)
MESFAGKVAVVTGAASGIGNSLARRFAAEGMKVVLADIEATALDRAVAAMEGDGHEVLGVRTDVSDGDSVDALAAATLDRFGAVHIVCNNAGVFTGGRMWELPTRDWQWVLGVNLWGVIHGIRAFVPHLVAHGEGHVVNTASMAGLVSYGGMGPYNASKHAVVTISETLHHELAAAGVDVGVSVLCPGLVATHIGTGERNRPVELGGRARSGDDAAPEMAAVLAEMGMAPDAVAAQVFDAIGTGRFYVLTHGDADAAVARTAVIEAGGPPADPRA